VPKDLVGKTVTVKVQFDLAPLEMISKPIDVQLGAK
jgi:hypothetical protein